MIETVIETVGAALEWIVLRVDDFGYIGIFVMMFLESTFFPFPSEVAMIPAGFLASRDRMDFSLAVLAGLLGSLAGALFNYWLARVIGIPVLRRYGKYIFFDEKKLERCNEVFRRHGEVATFVCRLIPVVRQYISLPAGTSGMNLARFGLYTGLGAGIWMVVLTGFGYWVGVTMADLGDEPTWADFKRVWTEHKTVIYPTVAIGIASIIALYAWRYRARRRRADQPPAITPPASDPPSD